jgi:tetratricopeptide (TPR) repeat protein
MHTHRRRTPGREEKEHRETPRAVPQEAVLALQRSLGNQATARALGAQPQAGERVLARRQLTGSEREQLSAAKTRLRELEQEYEQAKASIMDALEIKNQFNDALAYLHKMNLSDVTERVERTEKFFREAHELEQQAGSSDKQFDAFMRKVRGYEQSGGRNTIQAAVAELNRKLKSVERNELTQITELDEDYFKQYRASPKAPMTVYRGNGIGVTATSLDAFAFQDIPYGGTPDVSFAGVVEHTHTNTLKNGMVSTTSSFDVAHFWATSKHPYGIVYEILLDDYIHVANLLGRRNFKDRYPKQFEILAPGSVPSGKVVSATLYQKDQEVKKVTNGG